MSQDQKRSTQPVATGVAGEQIGLFMPEARCLTQGEHVFMGKSDS